MPNDPLEAPATQPPAPKPWSEEVQDLYNRAATGIYADDWQTEIECAAALKALGELAALAAAAAPPAPALNREHLAKIIGPVLGPFVGLPACNTPHDVAGYSREVAERIADAILAALDVPREEKNNAL